MDDALAQKATPEEKLAAQKDFQNDLARAAGRPLPFPD